MTGVISPAISDQKTRLEASLDVRGVSVSFSGVSALTEVDLHVPPDEALGLIGPNGAGKTTLVNVITGYTRPNEGRVYLGDQDVTSWPPDARGRAGLARTFQSVRLFAQLTTRENVEAAAIGSGSGRRQARQIADRLLEEFDLTTYRDLASGSLPFGIERRLSLARAVASQPRFLLLDEPAAGLNEAEKAELAALIDRVRRERACGVLIIEHDMRMIHTLCDRVQILAEGKVLAVGTPSEMSRNAEVIDAFLGKEAASEWTEG